MCPLRKESSKSLLCGKRTIRVACLCLSALLMVLLLITLVFHLNHNRNKDSITDETSVRDRVEFSSKSCVFENGISIQIPQSADFHMETVAKSSKDSKNFQASMLQITKKLIHSLKVANNTAEKIDLLSTEVKDQLNYIYRSLDFYGNSNRLLEFIEQPLKNVTQSTEKIAQYFLLTARKFEQLFDLMKVVVHGSIGKKLIDLERSLYIVEGQMNSSVHSKRKLEKAIESMTNSSIEAALRLQQNQDEFEMATLELKSLQSRSNSVNCFENWEWNWWPLTYTTTSTCFGRPSDDDWANSKSRLENAKWKSNCSNQEVSDVQEKIQKWNKVDQDLSIFIEKLAKNKNNLHKKLAMFNGTSGESLVQMESETCKMTAGFTNIYMEAAEFFLNISARISNNLAILEPTTANMSINSRPMPSDTFLELRSNLKKITNEVLDRGAVFANIPKLIFRHSNVFRFEIEQLRQMRTQKTINSGSLVKLLANIRKSHLKRNKSADQISQKCD
jgi:hypothetical protein